jgi:asparagine synthase (glutamine-hydrolysing)
MYAGAVARSVHAQHREVRLMPARGLLAACRLSTEYDEPLGNSSAIAAYWCAQYARDAGMQALFAGDGGDEILGGNDHYRVDRYFQVYDRIPERFRRLFIDPSISILSSHVRGKPPLPLRYLRRATIPYPRRMFSYTPFFGFPPSSIMVPDVLEAFPPVEWTRIHERHYNLPQTTSVLNRQMYLDLKTAIADNDLRKVVGTAEMAGIRTILPLLDCSLVEFAATIPARYKMRGSKLRYLHRLAMKGLLPEIVLQKQKCGFGIPIGAWMAHDSQWRALVHDVAGDRIKRRLDWINPSFVEMLVSRVETDPKYGQFVWQWLSLELWCREHTRMQVSH